MGRRGKSSSEEEEEADKRIKKKNLEDKAVGLVSEKVINLQPNKNKGFLNLSVPGVFLVNSKSQGGKSHLCHCTFYVLRDKFSYGICFCQSAFNAENLTYIDKRFVHLRYSPHILRLVLLKQASIPKPRKPVWILLSDCVSDLQQEDKVLFEACTQSTHYDIFVVIETQNINTIPNWARGNAFQIALFKQWTEDQLKAAYKAYGQNFKNLEEFKEKVNNKLGDHKFAFSDRQHGDGSFMICKCPAELPKFKLPVNIPKVPKRKREKAKSKRKKKKRKVENEPIEQ
jgi:hypothetical protein